MIHYSILFRHRRHLGATTGKELLGVILGGIAFAGLLIAAETFFAGCTISARPVSAKVEKDAHFLGFYTNAAGVVYGKLDSYDVARYNALVDLYSNRFAPVLVEGAGISMTATNAFLIDRDHFLDFSLMSTWHRSGLTN